MGQEIHEVTDACGSVHCAYHQMDEPGRGYQICLECGHLYKTKRDLRRRHRHTMRELLRGDPPWLPDPRWTSRLQYWWRMLFLRADKIYSCPFCAHDF